MAPTFVYTAVFALTLASGEVMEADEASFPTYDSCMVEAESEARQLAREWAWEEERTGLKGFYRGVEVRCEKRPAPKAKKGSHHGR